MESPRPRSKRSVKARVLLAAAAGAAVISLGSCGGNTVGNLLYVPCDTDGGPDGGRPGCETETDSGATTDAGIGGDK